MVYACYQPPTLSVAVLREWRCGRSSSRLPRSTSLSAYRSILRSAGLLRPMCQSTSLQRHSRKTASRPTVHLLAGLAGASSYSPPLAGRLSATAHLAAFLALSSSSALAQGRDTNVPGRRDLLTSVYLPTGLKTLLPYQVAPCRPVSASTAVLFALESRVMGSALRTGCY
jgi:hypothetical protein